MIKISAMLLDKKCKGIVINTWNVNLVLDRCIRATHWKRWIWKLYISRWKRNLQKVLICAILHNLFKALFMLDFENRTTRQNFKRFTKNSYLYLFDWIKNSRSLKSIITRRKLQRIQSFYISNKKKCYIKYWFKNLKYL